MDTLRGKLFYSPQERIPVQILTDSGIYDLWIKIEPTFCSLCGNDVICEITGASFSLALNKGGKYWKFSYEGSREKMHIWRPGTKNRIDIAKHLEVFFSSLHGENVTVEADSEHFKLSATQDA